MILADPDGRSRNVQNQRSLLQTENTEFGVQRKVLMWENALVEQRSREDLLWNSREFPKLRQGTGFLEE